MVQKEPEQEERLGKEDVEEEWEKEEGNKSNKSFNSKQKSCKKTFTGKKHKSKISMTCHAIFEFYFLFNRHVELCSRPLLYQT